MSWPSKTVWLLLLLLFAVPTSASTSVNSKKSELHCPVSAIVSRDDGMLTYPVDIFYPSPSEPTATGTGLIACTALDHSCPARDCSYPYPHTRYSCTTNTTVPSAQELCPLPKRSPRFQNARKVRLRTCCSFAEHLLKANDSVVTIHVLGGSVTVGETGAGGCCCDKRIDASCGDLGEACLKTRICGWIRYFTLWVHRHFQGRVRVADHAQGGRTSLEYLMSNAEPSRFTPAPSDIVLLDFSANDYSMYGATGLVRTNLIIAGAEGLIRRFLSQEGGAPAVVLLEMWRDPEDGWEPRDFEAVRGTTAVKDNDQALLAYRLLADHYGIPLWSYPDAYFISTEGLTGHERVLWDTLRFRYNNKYDSLHPPWYLHLVYADLMAHTLLRSIGKCRHTKAAGVAVPHSLPSPLFDNPSVALDLDCVPADLSPVAAAFHATNIDADARAAQVFAFEGWSFVTEAKNKTGWVSTMLLPSQTPATLTYTFTKASANTSRPYPFDYNNDLAFSLQFLRTYENAGVVSVAMCGIELGKVDALWPNPAATKFSVATTAYGRFCDFKTFCENTDQVALTLTHSYESIRGELRGRQKFKVLGLSLCGESRACTRDMHHTHFLTVY